VTNISSKISFLLMVVFLKVKINYYIDEVKV